MVFSQTSHKTHSILKVVELDRLKPHKNQQVSPTGVTIDGKQGPSSPVPTTSHTQDYLKPEPVFETTMFHESDAEFFQDLVPWCSQIEKEEQVRSIDSHILTAEQAHNTDTLHTPFSPQGWEVFGTNSPTAQAGFYYSTPKESPNLEQYISFDNKFVFPINNEHEPKMHAAEQFLDISNLPVVLDDVMAEVPAEQGLWPVADPIGWTNTQHDTLYHRTKPTPFIQEEDSLDMKLDTVMPRQVENNDVVISEYIINDCYSQGALEKAGDDRRGPALFVNVEASAPAWPDGIIGTPEVLNCVEQLEKENSILPSPISGDKWPAPESGFVSFDTCTNIKSPSIEYEPITPKSESLVESDNDDFKNHTSKRRRHDSDSEDSDEEYTPYTEHTPRKYKRRKSNVPLNEMIRALEGSQQLTKARRGRPPKRRESTVSSVCSVDENSSNVSTDTKYRNLRDKNNEASKRSRMNRKLKELQMEQLVVDLEEKNKKLKVKADILEDMTKRLKDALMTAILHK